MHKFLLTISKHDVPRLRQLVAKQLRQGASNTAIHSKVADYLDGVHHAKVSLTVKMHVLTHSCL